MDFVVRRTFLRSSNEEERFVKKKGGWRCLSFQTVEHINRVL
jgi:hypothetical protein